MRHQTRLGMAAALGLSALTACSGDEGTTGSPSPTPETSASTPVDDSPTPLSGADGPGAPDLSAFGEEEPEPGRYTFLPFGGSEADLPVKQVDGIAADKGSRTTAPERIELGGHQGLYLEVTAPTGRAFTECDSFELWGNDGGGMRCLQGPGQVERLWILDVPGERLVIDASSTQGVAPSLCASGSRPRPSASQAAHTPPEGPSPAPSPHRPATPTSSSTLCVRD